MRWMMLAILFTVRLAMGYQFQSVASVSAQLIETFGFSYAQIGGLIGFFLLPGVFMALPSGVLTRAIADKKLLMLGAAVMAVGAALMAVAQSPTQLYAGRLLTGVGGTIFSLVLTKMVTDWFFGKEIMTALSIMLVAWPIGIALALLTQGPIANTLGWSGVMLVCSAAALVALALIAGAYRAPPAPAGSRLVGSLRFGLPGREMLHVSVAGICWAAYNASLILVVSFGPDALVARGWTSANAQSAASLMMWAMLLSLPLGGRLLERLGYVTFAITVSLLISALCTVSLFLGLAPAVMFLSIGLSLGVPGGALVALASEAVSPANRGLGLGVFYTWFYVAMAAAPPGAGWLRDAVDHAGAPLLLVAGLMTMTVLGVLLLRLLQARWPISGTPH